MPRSPASSCFSTASGERRGGPPGPASALLVVDRGPHLGFELRGHVSEPVLLRVLDGVLHELRFVLAADQLFAARRRVHLRALDDLSHGILPRLFESHLVLGKPLPRAPTRRGVRGSRPGNTRPGGRPPGDHPSPTFHSVFSGKLRAREPQPDALDDAYVP